MTDDKVTRFRPRLIKTDSDSPKAPILLACHCSSTNYELVAGKHVRCSRCGCLQPIRWAWEDT